MKLATPPRQPVWRVATLFFVMLLGLSVGGAASDSGPGTDASPSQRSAVTGTGAPVLASYAPLPQAVTSFGAVVSEGWLYVYGGHLGEQHEYSADMVSASFLQLDLAEGLAWETRPSGPPAQGASLVAHAGLIYRVGGMAARNAAGEKRDLRSLDSVARFDPASDKWTDLPSLPEARSSHDAVVAGDRLYVGGGWRLGGGTAGAKFHETVVALDLAGEGGKWASLPQPFQRRGLAMAAVRQKIYFIGGMGTDEQPSRAVDVFDTITSQWSKGPDLPDGPMKGFGASACSVGDDLFVSGMTGDVLKLNAAAGSWDKAGTLRQPRFFHRLVPASPRRLLALGGTSRAGKLSSVEPFNLDSAQAAAGAAWPQWRGARRDGISREDGWLTEWPKEGPQVLWKASLGKGLSSFAAANGRIYTLGNRAETDTIYCFDSETGRTLWTHAYPCASTNHAMSIVPNGPASTPTLDGDRLYTLSREGDLLCLDANSGRPVWERHLLRDLGGKRPVYGYASSLLVLQSLVLVDAGGTNVSTTALDKWTGKTVWAAGTMEAGYSSAVPLDGGSSPAVAMFKGEGLVILDSGSGKQLCQYPWESRDFTNTATPVVAGTKVFVSSTNTEGGAMLDWKPDGMAVLWKKPDMAMLFNSCVLWEGHLYGFDESTRTSSKLKCLDAESGEPRWVVEDIEKGAFLMAGGKLVILTNRGELAVGAVSPQGFKLLARAQVLGGRCWAAPVLADGRAYCRNNDGEMVCLDLRKKS